MTADEVLTRGVDKVLPDKNSLSKLMDSKKIRVYLGIDPTGPKLHLGHTIPLRKLQAFADLGHEAILVFGTGTVLAGDPSQRKEARGQITQKEIDENIKDWKRQAAKVLDFSKVEVKQNGDWLLKLTIPELIKIESKISAAQLFKRDMFQERLAKGDTVAYHETLYPILQGYDSVHLDVDVEIGGTDQIFNMLIGRELQKKINNREKFVISTPLISGTDGKQMTKSTGNCIWLSDTPEEMTRKIHSLADTQIEEYWINLTDLNQKDLNEMSPQNAKQMLALELVKVYHGAESVSKSETSGKLLTEYAQKNLSHETMASLPTVTVPPGTSVLNLGTAHQSLGSVSYVKELIRQGAVDVNFDKVTGTNQAVHGGEVVRFGKKNIFKIEEQK